jgi:hypothetical protein
MLIEELVQYASFRDEMVKRGQPELFLTGIPGDILGALAGSEMARRLKLGPAGQLATGIVASSVGGFGSAMAFRKFKKRRARRLKERENAAGTR